MVRVTGDSSLQSEVLEDLRDARRYRRWLADLARPHLGRHPIEIGSGTGDYAVEWIGDVDSYTATEADETRFEALAQRFSGHPIIRTRFLLLGGDDGTEDATSGSAPDTNAGTGTRVAGPGGHSAAVAFNVFEHIPDHVAALRAMAQLVRPGGAVVLLVPAFPSAMSRFDRAIGHQRRYTRASLRQIMDAAALDVHSVRYVNPLGLLSWYVTVKALRMTPRDGLALRTYDRLVVPLARALDRVPAPFGQSVLGVARVP